MSSLSSPHGGRSGPGWDQALPCLLRIVAACPPSRFMRVCATYTKTFPGHGRSPTSNLLDETCVPVITPGTPEANGPGEARTRKRTAGPPAGSPPGPGQRCEVTGRARGPAAVLVTPPPMSCSPQGEEPG